MEGDIHVEPAEAGLKRRTGAGRDSATTKCHGWQTFSNGDTRVPRQPANRMIRNNQ